MTIEQRDDSILPGQVELYRYALHGEGARFLLLSRIGRIFLVGRAELRQA